MLLLLEPILFTVSFKILKKIVLLLEVVLVEKVQKLSAKS